ncbi:glycosyltransferase family 4 protein [Sulfurovum sp.]|uniref:glycosyltransferase family 4 protein n=1 Tax=Sulfurovum sp. TaxID=1969726 RepID=UPI003567761D
MKKTKIAITPDSLGHMGGTRSFLLTLLSLHHKNNIATVLAIQSNQLDKLLLEFCVVKDIEILLLKPRGRLFHKPYFSILYDIYVYLQLQRKVRPSLILASIGSPRLLTGLFFFNTPLIYYVHTYPEMSSRKSKGMDLITKYLVNSKQFVISVSNFSKSVISQYMNVPEKYIDVIYNSVENTNKAVVSTEKKDIILTVGHVEEYKNPNIWYLVAKDVIKEMPSSVFQWVGEGSLLESMREKVKKDRLEKNIVFEGLSNSVNKFYKSATIYFHPSLIESQGIAIAEAMSFGLPCVGSNIGGIPESILDQETGFILNVDDVKGFSEKICLLLKNEKTRNDFGVRGQKLAAEKFSKSTQEEKIMTMYNQILEEVK